MALESEPASPQPAPVAPEALAFLQGLETIMRGLAEHRREKPTSPDPDDSEKDGGLGSGRWLMGDMP